jgi:hypothetical protein
VIKTTRRSRDAVERVIRLDAPDKVALVEELKAFVKSRGQSRLGWSTNRVATLELATRKLARAVTYRLVQIRRGDSAGGEE